MFEWVAAVMARGGYGGLAFLMLAENVFPPIPSELVMPLAGFLSARGDFWLPMAILAGLVGTVAGALFWYWIGLRIGAERLRALAARHGRLMTLSPGDIDRAERYFHDRGLAAIFVGRMLPGSRTLISVPAGMARMPMVPFLVATTAGSLVWIGGLAIVGYVLESQYDRVAAWVDPALWFVVGAVVGVYLWRLFRQEMRG